MATPSPTLRSSVETKKTSSGGGSGVITRNGARKAKIQTRAMSNSAKPSAALLAAKKKGLQKKRNSFEITIKDHYQVAMESKNVVRGEVGLVVEPKMLQHRCLWDDNYPENPERLASIIRRCEELNLFKKCKSIPPRAATKEEVLQLHSPSVYEMLLSTHENQDEQFLEEISSRYDAIYIHPSTHELALISAGSTIDLVSAVVKREVDCGMALVRPPGHHAMGAEPCGYCFYNNVALAARHAITKLGVQRILIVDWDVHHGQATQQMFYDDPRVVYFSIHRYEHGAFWPNLKQSNFNYVGCGAGTGYNFNVPLNRTKMQDADYLAIWHQLLLPMAVEFDPQLVIISAGYDSAIGDEKGEMEVSPMCYAHLSHLLQGVCSSIAVVLEGGYCPASLSEGAALTLRQLLGAPAPSLLKLTEPTQSIKETILNCIYAHKPYWQCFNYQPTYCVDPSVVCISGGGGEGGERHVVEVRWEGSEEVPDRYPTRDCYPVQSQAFVKEVLQRLANMRITTNLLSPPDKVCYVYDDAMLKHKNLCEPGHVERPERLTRVHSRMTEWGLLPRMRRLPSRTASEAELLLAHTQTLVSAAKATATSPPRNLIAQQQQYDSLYLHPDSYLSAGTAAGCVLQVVDSVLNGECRSGVCAVRPPGHHASEDVHCGFCIFNNVAIAAKYAISAHALKRILIVDWDVHHGNGTQSIFLEDPRVMYISIHRYEHGTFFPHSKDGDHTCVGSGRGKGYNINIPWNKRGMGDVEYLAAFTQVVLPIAYEFNPELVLVSAGFDACVGDPLGGCKVTPECYGRLTHWLSALANGKLILCLEGGYNITAISYAMAMCTKALLGDPLPPLHDARKSPHPSAVESINQVISVQKEYWKNLAFQIPIPSDRILPPPEPSRGLVVRENQYRDMFTNINKNKPEKDDTFDTSSEQTNTSYDTSNVSEIDKSVDAVTDKISSLDFSCSDADSTLDVNSSGNVDSNVRRVADNNETLRDSGAGSSTTQSSEAGASSSSSGDKKKQSLADYLAENMTAIMNEEMFAVIPLKWCPHLESIADTSTKEHFVQGEKCIKCDHTQENWVCLHCYTRACGRYINGHMLEHCQETESKHCLVLSLVDLSVWCSECEAYVDHPRLYHHRNLAHQVKFNEILPWSYGESPILTLD